MRGIGNSIVRSARHIAAEPDSRPHYLTVCRTHMRTALPRQLLLAAVTVVAAACGEASTAPADPSIERHVPSVEDVRRLRIAVDDGMLRLLPNISSDASGPMADALRDLHRTLDGAPSQAALSEALSRVGRMLATYSDLDRADRETLDALSLELSLAPHQ